MFPLFPEGSCKSEVQHRLALQTCNRQENDLILQLERLNNRQSNSFFWRELCRLNSACPVTRSGSYCLEAETTRKTE